MADFDFDLIVIGGGSGGVRMARWSGSLGAKVAIIEGDQFGGTCVIRGCVPKKMMALGSEFSHELETMKDYGWKTQKPEFDFEMFRKNREKEIARLSGLYQGMLEKSNVSVMRGMGVISGEHSVDIGDRTYTAKSICIAVGGKPWKLPIEGAQLAMTSDEMFNLSNCPKSVTVVGSGYIGLEFAGIFNGYGSEVNLVCRSNNILTGFDDETRAFLREQIKQKGIKTHYTAEVQKLEKIDSGLRVHLSNGEKLETEICLMATGRRPNTEKLGLESVGVKTNDQGAILIDENYRTNVKSIYALGDVTDRMNLTPVATAEAMVLAEQLFSDGARQMDYAGIPTAVFSHPPLATVGLSEEAAKAAGLNIKTFTSSFRNLKFTLSEGGERTFMKLIVDEQNQEVIGCHMVGKDAPEVMQGVAIAIKAGATKQQFDQTIGIHPTSAEEFVTMRG